MRLNHPLPKMTFGVPLVALLFVGPLSAAADDRQWSCISSHACVSTTPCTEKQVAYSIRQSGGLVVLKAAESEFQLLPLAPADGAVLRAYGQPTVGQGTSSLTLFDDLTFVYSSHVSIEMNTVTGQLMGLSVSVLGTCETVVS